MSDFVLENTRSRWNRDLDVHLSPVGVMLGEFLDDLGVIVRTSLRAAADLDSVRRSKPLPENSLARDYTTSVNSGGSSPVEAVGDGPLPDDSWNSSSVNPRSVA